MILLSHMLCKSWLEEQKCAFMTFTEAFCVGDLKYCYVSKVLFSRRFCSKIIQFSIIFNTKLAISGHKLLLTTIQAWVIFKVVLYIEEICSFFTSDQKIHKSLNEDLVSKIFIVLHSWFSGKTLGKPDKVVTNSFLSTTCVCILCYKIIGSCFYLCIYQVMDVLGTLFTSCV